MDADLGDISQWPPQRDPRRVNPASTDTAERLLPRSQIRRQLEQPEMEAEQDPESAIGVQWEDQQDMCRRARIIDTLTAAGQNEFDRFAEQLVESFGMDYFACFEDQHRISGTRSFRGRAKIVMGVSSCLQAVICQQYIC